MFSLKTPWSNYAVEVGFERVSARESHGVFLRIDNAELYERHVIAPLQHGQKMQKTASIFAWPLGVAQEWATQDISGIAETAKSIRDDNAKEELFLVFSSHEYDHKQAYQIYMLVHNMSAMAKSSLSKDDLYALQKGDARFSVNTSVYGIWTIGSESLNAKYDRYEDARFPDVYLPRPEALRVVAPIAAPEGYEGIEMPTIWGSFKIRNGGHIAIAISEQNDHPTGFQQMQRHMNAVTAGADFAGLFLTSSATALRSTLDIYGIEPGFVQANYSPV